MGGCLPLLVQFPILLGLYRVIQQPITWIVGQTPLEAVSGVVSSGQMTSETALSVLKEAVSKVVSADVLKGLDSIQAVFEACGKNIPQIDIASKFHLVNFDFMGLDLSATPDIQNPSLLWLVPILATGAAFFSNWVSRKINPVSAEQEQSMKGMTMMMPLMTAFFTFTLSAGIGVYWFISTMFSVAQMIVLTKYFENKYPAKD